MQDVATSLPVVPSQRERKKAQFAAMRARLAEQEALVEELRKSKRERDALRISLQREIEAVLANCDEHSAYSILQSQIASLHGGQEQSPARQGSCDGLSAEHESEGDAAPRAAVVPQAKRSGRNKRKAKGNGNPQATGALTGVDSNDIIDLLGPLLPSSAIRTHTADTCPWLVELGNSAEEQAYDDDFETV